MPAALRIRFLFPFVCSLFLLGCGTGSPRFLSRPQSEKEQNEPPQLEGVASYYADEFNGRTTSNGETYDMNAMTAAHRTLPFNTVVRVTNLQNHLSVVVRINDRGPFKDDRVIDLSFGAAKKIGLIPNGTAPVTLEIVQSGPLAR
jgi:rare lipoprotein A